MLIIIAMKLVTLLFILLTGCTQKYVDYDLIRKVDFNQKSYERPVTLMQVLPNGKDHLKSCFDQWLFFSNADKQRERAIPFMVKSLCPGKDFLMKTEMKESWWTTIVYTRSCADIETMCAEVKK